MRESIKNKWLDALGIGGPIGPLGKVAKSAIEEFRGQKFLATEKLKALVEKAGYRVQHQSRDNGVKVEVYGPSSHTTTSPEGTVTVHTNPDGLVAAGYDSAFDEAMAAALFGAWREEQADSVITHELEQRGLKVDDTLRLELQQRFITKGGLKRLQADLDAFPKPKDE